MKNYTMLEATADNLKYQRLEGLTVEAERVEVFSAIGQTAILRVERPQSDFKGGWLRMWTIMNDFYDKKGFNRKHGTFTELGLQQLGIIKGDL